VIKEWVFRAVEDIFQRRGCWNGSLAQLFGDCVGRDGSETEQFQRQFITAIVRPLGLDGDKMAEAWRLSGNGHEAGNIRALAELERRVPGIAKRLESQFGIRCFDRYPVEVLERQAEENETDRPYGVIVMSRGDHSGAFYRLKDAWGDLQRDIGDTFAIRIVEAGSKFELGKRMLSLDRRYGQKQKISFAVVNGHGVPNQVRLGAKLWYWQMGQEIEFNHDDPQPRDVLDKSDFLGTGFRRGKEMFKLHPTIVLFSCSTGAPEGVAKELARAYEADVIAPSTPASLEKMHAIVEDGEVRFDIKLKLNGEGGTVTYSGK
jgi:hypothetical protein